MALGLLAPDGGSPTGKPATSGSGWHEQAQTSEQGKWLPREDERCVEVFRFGRLLFAHRSPFGRGSMMMMMALMTTFDEASRRRRGRCVYSSRCVQYPTRA